MFDCPNLLLLSADIESNVLCTMEKSWCGTNIGATNRWLQFVGHSRIVRLIDVSTIFRVARFDITFKWRSLPRKISTSPTRITILSCLISDSPGTDSLEYSPVDRPQARQLARQEYSVFSQDYSVFSLDYSESSRTAAAAEAPGDTSHKKNPDDKIKSFNSKVLRGGWNIYSVW